MKNVVILISGRGSNMEALLRSDLTAMAHFAAVISNSPDAQGLAIAQSLGVATQVVDHHAYDTRESFDAALAQSIEDHHPDLVVLAGFMRILTPAFVARFEGRLINIHPSLLPAFPGIDTHRRALEQGVRIHGCSVHFVTAELDGGPIIAQAAVPVSDEDTPTTLAARVLVQEHHILPAVVRWYLDDRLRIDGRVVRMRSNGTTTQSLIAPAIS